jgi:recombination protein RecA
LHAGGFRVVVLDLASAPSEQALRIPSATWFRFRRAAQDGDAILLLLTQQPCAQSSAACVVQCFPRFESSAVSNVFGSLHHSAEVIRQRSTEAYGKKAAGRVAQWEAAAPWMRAVGK